MKSLHAHAQSKSYRDGELKLLILKNKHQYICIKHIFHNKGRGTKTYHQLYVPPVLIHCQLNGSTKRLLQFSLVIIAFIYYLLYGSLLVHCHHVVNKGCRLLLSAGCSSCRSHTSHWGLKSLVSINLQQSQPRLWWEMGFETSLVRLLPPPCIAI